MKYAIILILLLLFITYELNKEVVELKKENVQLRQLYNQAIQWQETKLPHKTKNYRLLWKTKG